MVVVQIPGDESARLQVVRQLTDLPFQAFAKRLQPLSRVLAQICETPSAQISLVDQGIVRIMSSFGDVHKEIPRNRSVSAHTILVDEALLVQDTAADPRFTQVAEVCDGHPIRFYAGIALRVGTTGHRVGALSVLDDEPRVLRPVQISAIVSLSLIVNQILDLALAEKELASKQTSLEEELRQTKNSLQGLESRLRDTKPGSQSRRS